MDSLKLPTTAARANAFTAPGSLSFPQGIEGKNQQENTNGDASSQQEDSITKKEEPADGISVKEPNQEEEEGAISGIVPTLQNIVATVNLDCRLDLKTIALHARNAEYNPKRFAAVIMRIREPKTTALIFASGKMVVTGAKSEDDSKLASRKYARIIQKLGFNAKFTDFKIQNIVGSCDVKFPIRLEDPSLAVSAAGIHSLYSINGFKLNFKALSLALYRRVMTKGHHQYQFEHPKPNDSRGSLETDPISIDSQASQGIAYHSAIPPESIYPPNYHINMNQQNPSPAPSPFPGSKSGNSVPSQSQYPMTYESSQQLDGLPQQTYQPSSDQFQNPQVSSKLLRTQLASSQN
ncbi:hypothetical protein QCA50_012098 [Cerrena zonata]|uniref:TATA-box-binding protein n=1 Tax=Cerrena zonata TaxID=2478898 RepID=A0AAW0FVD3_9APHY